MSDCTVSPVVLVYALSALLAATVRICLSDHTHVICWYNLNCCFDQSDDEDVIRIVVLHSVVDIYQCSTGTCCLYGQGRWWMQQFSFGMLVCICQTTWRHIPEDGSLIVTAMRTSCVVEYLAESGPAGDLWAPRAD